MKIPDHPVPAPLTSIKALQVFEPQERTIYTIETTANLVHVSRRFIAICYKLGLISSVTDPVRESWHFNGEAIRTLRRIEYLRTAHGINLAGVKLAMNLMNEIERLRNRVRALSQEPPY